MLRHPQSLYVLILLACCWAVPAQAIENSATGTLGGVGLEQSGATVRLTRRSTFLTDLTAEIVSPVLYAGALNRTFSLFALPRIDSASQGYDTLVLELPSAIELTDVTALNIRGAALTSNCANGATNAFCATVTGQILTLRLSEPVSVDGALARLDFSANIARTAGDYVFELRALRQIDNAAIDATPGDADGVATNANSLTVQVAELSFDNTRSTINAIPPQVLADGQAYGTVTVTLRDTNDAPLAGVNLRFSSDRDAFDTYAFDEVVSDSEGRAVTTIRSTSPGIATLSAQLLDLGIDLDQNTTVTFTQGVVLQLTKSADDREAVVGDVVNYRLVLRNLTDRPVINVRLKDAPPRGFKFVPGSAQLDGVAVTVVANQTSPMSLEFPVGQVAPFDDANGNGVADPGEPGYRLLTYSMIVGASARPDTYINSALAVDVCADCAVSNRAQAEVEVTLDPVFDLGTIIGKVYADFNGNGWQDATDVGIGGAMVALDDGTYALTDRHGRYHFPATRPGQRLVKINLASLPGAVRATTRAVQVLDVTPGLLAKANFGVTYQYDQRSIGRAGVTGVNLSNEAVAAPVQIHGSVRSARLAINGVPLNVGDSLVSLYQHRMRDVIELRANQLDAPINFAIDPGVNVAIDGWRILITDSAGTELSSLADIGQPPATVAWDGRDQNGALLTAGGLYRYQLELTLSGGIINRSEERVFGVNQRNTVAMSLSGGAFVTGSAQLTEAARELLSETANTIRQLPRDKILIEGHTDDVGSATSNLHLSEQRARAALHYLTQTEGLPATRFVAIGLGERRPLASNETEAGRKLNRRVEIKGEFTETLRPKIGLRQRQAASVVINGEPVPVGDDGRFGVRLDGDTQRVDFDIASATAKQTSGSVPLPRLDILQPGAEFQLPYGAKTQDYSVIAPSEALIAARDAVVVNYQLIGQTDPGNSLSFNGEPVSVHKDGKFQVMLSLQDGNNVFGLVARSPAGFSRVVNLRVRVDQRDANGPLMIVQPVPALSVQLPPPGLVLSATQLAVPGFTTFGNIVTINDQPVEVQADGRFYQVVTLPLGESVLRITATDTEGHTGEIEQPVEVVEGKLFFLALADGKVSQLTRSGNLQSGESSSDVQTQGRLAYYLKGTVAGKYLITSSYDSDRNRLSSVFGNLDAASNQRLLSNIDPDTVYPVYGDDSTLVYDAQSQGKFYLALKSDQLDALYGNYPINLDGGELVSYQRTLFGAQLRYTSQSVTAAGDARTQGQAFSATTRSAPVRDVLRATGGSLYYLSRNRVFEGSEQVSVVVRDRNTGLILSRTSQLRNEDYTITYLRGRILFNRPLSGFSDDGSLVNPDLSVGNPVTVEIDYEAQADGFESTVTGGRIQQRVGERLTVGVTHVDDGSGENNYALTGIDSELRLAKSSRLTAGFAQSRGAGTVTNVSFDGGMTYAQQTLDDGQAGNAYKLTAEVNMGDFVAAADGFRLSAYLKVLDEGFQSNGNASESGTNKAGMQLNYQLSDKQEVTLRHDRQRNLADDATMAQSTLLWTRTQGGWKLSTQIADRRGRGGNTSATADSTIAAARIRYAWSPKLSTSLEHQTSLRGPDNDQTAVSIDYQVTPGIALQASVTSGTLGQSGQLGLRYDAAGREYYLAQRIDDRADGTGGASTVLGVQAPLGERGKIYSEYQFGNSRPGAGPQSLLGVRRRWDVTERFNLLLGLEQSAFTTVAGQTERLAFSSAFNYNHPAGLTISSRNEWRDESGPNAADQFVTLNNLTYKLGDDLSVLGKYRYAIGTPTDSPDRDGRFREASLALAYRPTRHDRFNALARYTYLSDDKPGGGGLNELRETAGVWSAEWSYQINRHMEWVGKHAIKTQDNRIVDERTLRTNTQLAIQRINWRLPRHLALGTEYRTLTQREADDARRGWLMELSWSGMEHVRIGVGFNFTNFSDDELSDADRTEQGWFLRLQGTY